VLAIVVMLLLLRAVFIRRARTAYAPGPRVVVVGGDWRDGGIGGIGGREYQSPTQPPAAAATMGRQRGGDLGAADANEQLPEYEAAPPTYDMLYKDGPPQNVSQEMNDFGSSSSAAAISALPPAHIAPQTHAGAIVIDVEPPSQPAPTPPPVQEEHNNGRAWSRLTEVPNRQ